MSDHTKISWREWGDEAFAEARAQDKPILLDIGAVWCHWCHVMDDGIPGDPFHTGTYSHPEVQQRILGNFVPIKVDNDRRPDINARYNMGGWPTTAFLTPDGETLYGETYVPPDRMMALLDYIHDFYHNQKDDLAAQTAQVHTQRAEVERVSAASDLDPNTISTVIESVKRNFDFAFGGFGTQPKFPHPDALLLTLEQYARTGDVELRTVAEKTLQGMAEGGMYDRYAGGFFRYSTTRDWSVPHFEKMLEDNAKLTAAYALASVVLDDPRYLETVKSAHGWLLSDMRDEETGAFAGSQDADGEEHYYGQPLEVRATMPTPYIDRTVYAGWNALMVSSLVARYKITGEEDILEAARETFAYVEGDLAEGTSKRLRKKAEDEEEGLVPYVILHHFYADERPQGSVGLLNDQVDFIQAALELYEATAGIYYKLCAVEAADYVLDFLEDPENGGFYDLVPQPDAIGELARPKKEIGDNADAALALIRLSTLTEDVQYHRSAERALKLFAEDYKKHSFFASSYARAVEAALAPPLHIIITGANEDTRTQDLQRAAWTACAPGKAVETLDVDAARERGFPTGEEDAPRAYVCIGTNCNVVSTPEELTVLVRGEYENALLLALPD